MTRKRRQSGGGEMCWGKNSVISTSWPDYFASGYRRFASSSVSFSFTSRITPPHAVCAPAFWAVFIFLFRDKFLAHLWWNRVKKKIMKKSYHIHTRSFKASRTFVIHMTLDEIVFLSTIFLLFSIQRCEKFQWILWINQKLKNFQRSLSPEVYDHDKWIIAA